VSTSAKPAKTTVGGPSCPPREVSAVSNEIGELPADWTVRRFDSLFAVQQGKQVSKTKRIGENQRPFLRTKNVLWGGLDLSDLDAMHFTEEEGKRLALHPGDLLVCEGGDIGRTAIWNGALPNCCYQNHLHRARLRDRGVADSKFALYWLWYAFEVGSVYFGRGNVTTIPNLSQSRLCELPLPVPPLHEQQKIASVLGLVQRAIEQQERLLALTVELKKALLHQLFTQGLRSEPQKQTEIGPVPETWELTELGNVVHFFCGFAFKSEEDVKTSNTQLVRMGNLYQNKLDLTRSPIFYPDEFAQRYPRFVLKTGDLIMSLTGTSGKEDYGFTVELKGLPKTLLLNQRIARIDLISGRLTKDFLFYFLLSRKFLDYLYPTAKGMKQANLSTHAMKRLKVAIPSVDEQKELVIYFRTIDRKIEIHQAKVDSLRALFRTLLHQLMTAKIRINSIIGENLIYLIADNSHSRKKGE
jgi:type I restriction enzyme, S subunit